MIFNATCRDHSNPDGPSLSARQTSPIPPRPRSEIIRYPANREPGWNISIADHITAMRISGPRARSAEHARMHLGRT
jgi:hypothetical protein